MPSLLFYRGADKLLEYRLRPGRTTIGRADSCDVALPGDSVSRTHCFIDGEAGGWEIIDRSRHGTHVDGEAVRRAPLADGAQIGIGPFTVLFRTGSDVAPPTDDGAPARTHELLVGIDEALHITQATLVVVSGEESGRREVLRRPRVTVGGPGSMLALRDPGLRRDHCRLRISRGRVMLEPGEGPIYLDGQRLRDITPLYADEEFRIGDTLLRVDTGPAEIAPEASRFGEMVGSSRAMRRLFGVLKIMAGHDEPILILGESGTGKELAAQAVHEHSTRAAGPFVPINCGAIAETLFESELFGYEKGAFTGAAQRTDGAFQRADGGTLFLDEIGELPLEAQSKLLRALGGGGIRRVGSFEIEHPDVRILAATNRDLVRLVREGAFREDLFFRLETLNVRIPPLRERPEDLPYLANHLARAAHPEAVITPDAQECLQAHDWPGNVRELRNVLRRAYILGGPRIDTTHLSFHALSASPGSRPGPFEAAESTERAYLQGLLERHGQNRSAVARELGIPRSSLVYRMRRLGLG